MADKWIAECVPCGLLEGFDTQDAAIAAAENHVYLYHLHTPGPERARLKMGHVQNRTIEDETTLNAFPGVGAIETVADPNVRGELLPPMPSTLFEQVKQLAPLFAGDKPKSE